MGRPEDAKKENKRVLHAAKRAGIASYLRAQREQATWLKLRVVMSPAWSTAQPPTRTIEIQARKGLRHTCLKRPACGCAWVLCSRNRFSRWSPRTWEYKACCGSVQSTSKGDAVDELDQCRHGFVTVAHHFSGHRGTTTKPSTHISTCTIMVVEDQRVPMHFQ